MLKKRKLEKIHNEIKEIFDVFGPRVYRKSNLIEIFQSNSNNWNFDYEIMAEDFIRFIIISLPLQKIILAFPNRNEIRYIYGKCSIYDIVQSIKSEGYFSHQTAAEIHGVLEKGNNIFFNIEQSLRSSSSGEMTQSTITRAFQNQARISHNKTKFNEYTIWKLNGKNTNCYGVIQFNNNYRVTNLARTLIDIAVRPYYCSGPFTVLNVYRNCLEKVDGITIAETLKTLKHIYPFHQAIGFYMEKAGYKESHLQHLKKIPIKFDFYLDYKIIKPSYSSKWRLYYPSKMDRA